MLRKYMEDRYDSFIVPFGKYKWSPLTSVDPQYAMWWVDKRETDEQFGSPDISLEHKLAAERKYPFNATYLFFIYHVYKATGERLYGYTDYGKMASDFWAAIDSGASYGSSRYTDDELEAFLISRWEE